MYLNNNAVLKTKSYFTQNILKKQSAHVTKFTSHSHKFKKDKICVVIPAHGLGHDVFHKPRTFVQYLVNITGLPKKALNSTCLRIAWPIFFPLNTGAFFPTFFFTCCKHLKILQCGITASRKYICLLTKSTAYI